VELKSILLVAADALVASYRLVSNMFCAVKITDFEFPQHELCTVIAANELTFLFHDFPPYAFCSQVFSHHGSKM
jgi:hypothetical protein